ncbi:MarR family winged helix-turn-helix transcriptional regulator [Rhizobium miluonense]|uniref:DNA-binding transcriptional regulator, MarR family n=1 Tax=Rhizobium miluonense TaxID=411945 RepID=A0A1C3VJY0_9HYPH|nr:MarR family transcriptional regulator [Rhizobium miluonense]SCB28046.1 DNA-binding transcriptional regulator, MarR family [Rhizobium miluonense]
MTESESVNVDLEIIVQGAQEGKKLELRLWLRMLSTTKLISQEIRRRLRNEFGATLPQFDLMAQLYRERDGLRLGELSKRTMVTNGNVTGLVERLETDGLVRRATPDGDRRVTVAKLTERGVELFGAMAAAHEGWLRDMMADVDPAIITELWQDIGEVKTSVSNHLSGNDFD